jgi:hypothetical protein
MVYQSYELDGIRFVEPFGYRINLKRNWKANLVIIIILFITNLQASLA